MTDLMRDIIRNEVADRIRYDWPRPDVQAAFYRIASNAACARVFDTSVQERAQDYEGAQLANAVQPNFLGESP